MRLALGFGIVLTTAGAAPSTAQDPAALRKHVVEFISKQAFRPMPPGDTLLSWNGSRLVLFHTSARDSGGVRGALLRADRMFGIADVRWRRDHPQSFQVSWFTRSATSVDSLIIRGEVTGNELRVRRSGRADSVLALPGIRWAVADYGMEELLLPVLTSASQDSMTRVAVLRPYRLKWDTLTVMRTNPHGRWSVSRWTDQTGEGWAAVMLDNAHFVWLRRSEHPQNEKLPLDGSKLSEAFLQVQAELEPTSRPRKYP